MKLFKKFYFIEIEAGEALERVCLLTILLLECIPFISWKRDGENAAESKFKKKENLGCAKMMTKDFASTDGAF